MSGIKQIVLNALKPVLQNVWAVELPLNPTWPAIVFDIETQPETGWCLGGGYEQHIISVVILAKKLSEIETLQQQVAQAMKVIEGYLIDGEHGDGEYESDASVYAYFSNHTVRKRQQ